jgi:hypothetical protein
MCTESPQGMAHFAEMGDPVDLDEAMIDARVLKLDPEISDRIAQVRSLPSACPAHGELER